MRPPGNLNSPLAPPLPGRYQIAPTVLAATASIQVRCRERMRRPSPYYMPHPFDRPRTIWAGSLANRHGKCPFRPAPGDLPKFRLAQPGDQTFASRAGPGWNVICRPLPAGKCIWKPPGVLNPVITPKSCEHRPKPCERTGLPGTAASRQQCSAECPP